VDALFQNKLIHRSRTEQKTAFRLTLEFFERDFTNRTKINWGPYGRL